MFGMAQQAQASAQPLPPEAYSYASQYGLGEPADVYRVSYRQSIILGIIGLPLAALMAAVALFGENSRPASGVPLLLVGLFFLGTSVYYLIVFPLRHRSWRIYGCADGFVFVKGDQATACRWDQVATVWQKWQRTRNMTTFKYTIQRADGVQIILTPVLPASSQLGDRVQREVTARLAPQVLEAVRAGQTLPFGRYSLSQQGLTTPNEVLPWSEVQQVSANSGIVTIQRRGQRAGKIYADTSQIANLSVFLSVAEALVSAPQ
jgi:hypothetical protein